MGRENKILNAAAENIPVKSDPILGTPLVEICGQRRVLIENHQGVVGYGCNEICIKVRFGCIRVDGANLKLVKMSKDKLVITGTIDRIDLQRSVKNASV